MLSLRPSLLAAGLAAQLAGPAARAADRPLAAGRYGDLLLGYDPASKVVTGSFQSGTGDDGHGQPRFSCIFYLRGTLENGRATIETYFPATPKSASAARSPSTRRSPSA
jgi:hypothetical protein